MARAKKSSNKPAARAAAKKPGKPTVKPTRSAGRAVVKAAGPAARKPAARKPAGEQPAGKQGTGKRSPSRRSAGTAPEVDPVDEILEILACPPSTADQMSEVCEDGLEAIQDNLPHVAAAELVWRERPEHAELGSAITALIEELQRHAQVLALIHERLYPLAQDQAEHEDLDLAEVIERIRPLLEHHAHDHGDGHDHDYDHGDGGDHGHVHDDN